MENSPDVCIACNAQIHPGSKFCTECGKAVEETTPDTVEETPEETVEEVEETVETIQETESSQTIVNCPQCNAELTPEDKFCTECGAKIEAITNCPKCSAPIQPGTEFCTECGTNINEYETDTPVTRVQTGNVQTDIPAANIPPKVTAESSNDPMDELKETGIGLMQDVEKTGRGLMKRSGRFPGQIF